MCSDFNLHTAIPRVHVQSGRSVAAEASEKWAGQVLFRPSLSFMSHPLPPVPFEVSSSPSLRLQSEPIFADSVG